MTRTIVRKDAIHGRTRNFDLDVASSMKEKLCGRLACSDESFSRTAAKLRRFPVVKPGRTWQTNRQ